MISTVVLISRLLKPFSCIPRTTPQQKTIPRASLRHIRPSSHIGNSYYLGAHHAGRDVGW